MPKISAGEITEYLRSRDQWIRLLVNDLAVSHTAVRVGVHIAMQIDPGEREARQPAAAIAAMTGVSVRSVISALDALESAGYLMIEHRRNVGNRYELRFK